MTGFWRILVFTAPVMAAVIFIYLLVHQKFEADYTVENVRFEREWRAWEEDFGIKPPRDEFLPEQEREARISFSAGRKASEELRQARRDLKEVLSEMGREENGRKTPEGETDNKTEVEK